MQVEGEEEKQSLREGWQCLRALWHLHMFLEPWEAEGTRQAVWPELQTTLS